MKTVKMLLVVSFATILFSCSKKDSTTVIQPTVPASSPIQPGHIHGYVRGTFTTGNTYIIDSDIIVKPGDTLSSQQGVNVVVNNNSQIVVNGVLVLIGTQSQPITMNSSSNTPGSWGGINGDSAQAVTIKWTNLQNTGGPDGTGSPRSSIEVTSPIPVSIEDCWISAGQDNGILLENGATANIVRNTIISSGSTDGEAINIKTGVKGNFAYNVIYNQAGTAIKIETDDVVPFPQTIVNVYNNTIVANGWRRGAAEPGRAVSVGLNAVARIYNNLFVNNYQDLEIFKDADTVNTKYGNNLFYASVKQYIDSTVTPNIAITLRSNFYPGDGVGKPQSSDLISPIVSDSAGIKSYNPLFTKFDGTVSAPNAAVNNNIFTLQSNSPAIGVGNTSFSVFGGVNYSSNAMPNKDLGAYPTDGTGNKH